MTKVPYKKILGRRLTEYLEQDFNYTEDNFKCLEPIVEFLHGEGENIYTIRAFLIGLNPYLKDKMPIQDIKENKAEEVMSVATSFVRGQA